MRFVGFGGLYFLGGFFSDAASYESFAVLSFDLRRRVRERSTSSDFARGYSIIASAGSRVKLMANLK
jgi:hypothetical protein